MANKKNTRRALFMSVMSLILCCAMLMGTTFAWFTDEVTSNGNIIQSGTLDVTMEWADGTKAVPADDSAEWTDASDGAIFNYDKWEPGYVQVRHIKIANEGTLALKYQLSIEATSVASKLTDAIDVYYVDPAAQVTARSQLADSYKLGTLTEVLADMPNTASGELLADAKDTITLALKMREDAGNEYQELTIGSFAVKLNATQKTYEEDSFGSDYDILAQGGSTSAPAPAEGTTEVYTVYSDNNSNVKVATFNIPADAVEDDTKPISISVVSTAQDSSVKIESDQKAASFDVIVSNIKEGNTTPITVEMQIGTGRTGVEVYHKNQKIEPISYDETTGYVTFTTTSFSPYTVVYDAVAVPQEPTDNDLPQASLSLVPEHANTEIDWAGYNGLAPSNDEQQMEVVYNFSTTQTTEEMQASKYRTWHCDFYVSCDRDVADGAVFLGGNYGGYGWVGFENNGKPVSAGTKVPLLGSVGAPWTYEAIHNMVGNFYCGVARTYGTDMTTLQGATFTVELRLTNPEDENDFKTVETVNYTFTDVTIDTAEELKAAVANGGEVVLGADIDMKGVRIDIPKDSDVTIDLNGFTLTSKDGGDGNWMAIYVNEGANLTLNDSKGGGKIVASCYGVYVKPGATFTMNGGTISVSGNGVYDIGVTTWNSKFVMNGGTINARYAVWASDYYKNNGNPDLSNCEVVIADACVITASEFGVDIVDAPGTVLDVPAAVTVNRPTTA